MATFPVLSTGAVTQYPAEMSSGQGVQVIRFLDGTDQRFLAQPKALRQWQIRLELLNEAEIAQLELFFTEVEGDGSSFTFPDPMSGTAVPNCYLAAPGLMTQYLGVNRAASSFWVIETYGQPSLP